MEHVQRIVCGTVNCFLISNGKNAVLVDTGFKKYREKVLDACRPYQVRLLVLTHGHMDHVQNAAFLSQALHCPIAMHKADLPLLADNMVQPLSASSILGRIVLLFSVKSFKLDGIPAFSPTVFLEDGDSLDNCGISAKVVGLPGHTDGSIGLDVGERDLIVGDALMNMFYPTVSMLYHSQEIMLKSVEKIEKLGTRTIHFGHGNPVQNRKWAQ